MNRVAVAIENLRPRVEALDPDKRKGLDDGMAVEFDEHFAYQEAQARAHVMGKITPEEATIIYNALGEVGSESNGGWAKDTDLVTKVVVTKIIGELIGTGRG